MRFIYTVNIEFREEDLESAHDFADLMQQRIVLDERVMALSGQAVLPMEYPHAEPTIEHQNALEKIDLLEAQLTKLRAAVAEGLEEAEKSVKILERNMGLR